MDVPLERWLATRDVQGSKRRDDRAIWHAYCASRFGRMPVASISASRVLRDVLAYAMEDGRIARNPAAGMNVPGTKGTPGVAPTLAELRTLVAALSPPHHKVALVVALGGLRWSELAALDERDVVSDDDGRLFLAIRRRRVLDEQGKRPTRPASPRLAAAVAPRLEELAARRQLEVGMRSRRQAGAAAARPAAYRRDRLTEDHR